MRAPLSQSMPLREEPYASEAHAFFANLLPERPLRQRVAMGLGVSSENDFTLLLRIGGDCAGALSIGPQPADEVHGAYEELTTQAFMERLAAGDWVSRSGEATVLPRLSLAGAQGKFPIFYEQG